MGKGDATVETYRMPEISPSLQTAGYQTFEFDGYRLQLFGFRYTSENVAQSNRTNYINPHQHRFYEFFYVTQGCFLTSAGGRQDSYFPGQFGMLIPGLSHMHPINNHTILAVRFQLESCSPETAIQRNASSYINISALKKLTHVPATDPENRLWKLWCEIADRAGEGADALELKLLCAAFLVRMLQIYQCLPENVNDTKNRGDDADIVKAAIRYLQGHCLEQITVQDIAAHVHISYSHLARLFAHQGMKSISRLLKEARIDHAQHLLHTTDLSINDIAAACCFKYTSHFCRTFQEIVGVTASDYRLDKKVNRTIL